MSDPPPPEDPPLADPTPNEPLSGYWPPVPYAPPAGYGPPPYAYSPPPGYGPPPPGYGPPGYGPVVPSYGGGWYGPPGRIRPNGTTIALFICTLGIYGYVYNYQVHSEMKRHSGRGIGGGIALLLTFFASVAMPFVTPAEVGSLYSIRGERPPVNGWTGLWILLPLFGSYFLLFIGIVFGTVISSDSDGGSSTASIVALSVWIVLLFAGALTCGIVWLVKTNGALNRYWESLYH
jgi:hypothetical protein